MAQRGVESGVFLADDAIFSASEARVLTEDEEQAAIQPRPMDEILYIGSVVAQLGAFPVDIVNNVLELAGVLLGFQTETEEPRRGRSDMDEDYCVLQLPTTEELQVPDGVNVSKCALLVADLTSKDQGWATDGREHNGTYRASWSWSEIAVTRIGDDGEPKELKRMGLCPNLRAGRNFRQHRRYFTGSSELLEHIKLGSSVSIVLRSQFPGWSNSARYGRLAACFAVEFKDNFSFADIPFPETASEKASSESAIPCSIQ